MKNRFDSVNKFKELIVYITDDVIILPSEYKSLVQSLREKHLMKAKEKGLDN